MQVGKKSMENQFEPTYAEVVKTRDELIELISKKISKDKNNEEILATIIAVS